MSEQPNLSDSLHGLTAVDTPKGPELRTPAGAPVLRVFRPYGRPGFATTEEAERYARGVAQEVVRALDGVEEARQAMSRAWRLLAEGGELRPERLKTLLEGVGVILGAEREEELRGHLAALVRRAESWPVGIDAVRSTTAKGWASTCERLERGAPVSAVMGRAFVDDVRLLARMVQGRGTALREMLHLAAGSPGHGVDCGCPRCAMARRVLAAPSAAVEERQAGASAEECPGPGQCHGSLSWCSRCGTVTFVCDMGPRCDVHRERWVEAGLDKVAELRHAREEGREEGRREERKNTEAAKELAARHRQRAAGLEALLDSYEWENPDAKRAAQPTTTRAKVVEQCARALEMRATGAERQAHGHSNAQERLRLLTAAEVCRAEAQMLRALLVDPESAVALAVEAAGGEHGGTPTHPDIVASLKTLGALFCVLHEGGWSGKCDPGAWLSERLGARALVVEAAPFLDFLACAEVEHGATFSAQIVLARAQHQDQVVSLRAEHFLKLRAALGSAESVSPGA